MGFHTLLSLLLVTADSDRRARQRRRFQGSLATSARAGGTAPSGPPLGRPGSPGHSALTTGPAGRHTGSRRGHRSLLAIARADVPPHAPGLYCLRPEGPRERGLPRTVGGGSSATALPAMVRDLLTGHCATLRSTRTGRKRQGPGSRAGPAVGAQARAPSSYVPRPRPVRCASACTL